MIVSELPGRIRVRLQKGLDDQALEALRASVGKAASGAKVEHNPLSGSLLVTWTPGPKRDAGVRQALQEVVAASACPPKTGVPGLPLLKWPAMKTVKQGMAVSLGVALTALAFRSERVHAYAGGAFSLLLARHLYVYRKRLFK